jgi:hypothetical protein
MRTTVTTWTGAVTSPQLGTGRLTLTGAVEFLSHEVSHPTPHTLHFHATFKGGWLRGFLATASPCARTPDRCGTGQEG